MPLQYIIEHGILRYEEKLFHGNDLYFGRLETARMGTPPSRTRDMLSIGEYGGYKTKGKNVIETRRSKAVRREVDKEEHLKTYVELKGGIGI